MKSEKNLPKPYKRWLPIKKPAGSIAQRNANLNKDADNRFLIIGKVRRKPFRWVNIQSKELPGESGTENLP